MISFIAKTKFGNINKKRKIGDRMRKPSSIKIGKNLQKIRKSYGYTQERLAEEIEVSIRYISDMEQDRAKPSYEVLIRICNLYKIGLNQIFSGYLTDTNNKTLEYSLSGYEKLSSEDKETIKYLITYFNKKNRENI